MKYYETKIGKIIEDNFDMRMENMVFAYIFEKGMEYIRQITEEEIKQIPGNGLMTDNFCQALVRTAVIICEECEFSEITEYIRLYLFCKPSVNELILFRESFKENSFEEVLNELNLDNEKVGETIKIYAIVDENSLNENDEEEM